MPLHITTQHNNPSLRFHGFNNAWDYKLLKNLAYKSTVRNSNATANIVLTNSATKGVIPQGNFFTKDIAIQGNLENYLKLELNNFVYNPRISTSAPVGPFNRNRYGSGVVSPLYTIYKIKDVQDLDFLEIYLHTTHWHRYMKAVANYGARYDRMAIASNELDDLPIPYPDKEERNLVASFFNSLNESANVLQNHVVLLQKYKQGITQQIFSQRIRFKDESGNKYPNWQPINIGRILQERKTYTSKGGKLEHISLTTRGVVPKSARYERDFLVSAGSDKQYKITKLNDICYNPANLKFGVIARNKYGDGVFSPIYITYEVSGADVDFIEYLVTRQEFIQQARRYEEGTVYERMAVKPSDFERLIVSIPCNEEQHRIATFLSVLNDKIKLEESKLEQTKRFKKALLQQMFV